MTVINLADAASMRLAATCVGYQDPKAAERSVQNAGDAMQHQIIDRRAEAVKPVLPQTAFDRLLSTPGPLDRFGDMASDERG